MLLHDSDLLRGYLSTPVSEILADRQVKPLPGPYLTVILDTVNGADDKCTSYLHDASGT
jgi:hypothetical protein